MVDLAVELIERKSGKFTPDQFKNHYAEALRELVNKKMKGQKIIAPHEEVAPGGAKVIDLMAALRKSIGEGSRTKPKAKAKGATSGPKRTRTKAARKRA
jgi:DNA end-binding protein Ku